MALVLASVLVCLLRGIPVVWEFVADRRVFAPGGAMPEQPAPLHKDDGRHDGRRDGRMAASTRAPV
jgi:hypothetical protein